jgi:transposase
MPGAIINDTPEKAIRCPGLEPYDKRLSRTVLRGLGGRKAPWLPDRFRAGECDRKELQRRLIPLQARLGRLLRHGQANPDRKAAALCRELSKWWPALWTFARVEGVEPTNNVAERALRPAVLWRKGSFGSDSQAGSRFAERLLTVVASCRQQGRPVLEFLVAAGEAAALRSSPPPSLLSAPRGS